MIVDRVLIPFLQKRVWDPCSPAWFHRRVVREMRAASTYDPPVGVIFPLAFIIVIAGVLAVFYLPGLAGWGRALIHLSDRSSWGVWILMGIVLLAGVLACGGISEILHGIDGVLFGRRACQDAGDQVRAQLTAHERLAYEAHIRGG